MKKFLKIMVNFILIFAAMTSYAVTYYLDPIHGNIDNDGLTIDSPLPSLQEVIESNMVQTREYLPLPYTVGVSQLVDKNIDALIAAGDTLMLLDGLHGAIEIDRHYNHNDITIINYPGHTPLLASLHFRSASHWRVVGVSISSEPYGYYTDSHLLYVESHSFRGPASDMTIERCHVYAGVNGYDWTLDEWLDRTTNGIYIRGDNVEVVDCDVTNINFGIQLIGNNLKAYNNNIINFSGDGIRPLGSNIIVENNLIKNCFDINENHDDGIQSFNLNNEDYSNVIIRGNTIINFDDPDQPLRGSLQGIGCFDGPYNNWIVENNVVYVDHWHGITFLGAYDCIIRHNTVIDPTPDITPGASWIRISDHKDGTPSEGCIVANNIANQITVDADTSKNLVLHDYNDYESTFIDVQNFNFALEEGSPAIDNCDPLYTNDYDIAYEDRPQGDHCDIGAYEYVISTSTSEFEKNIFSLYPNPSSGIMYISADYKLAQVYNTMGKLVLQSINEDGNNVLDISRLDAAIYIVNIDGIPNRVIKL